MKRAFLLSILIIASIGLVLTSGCKKDDKTDPDPEYGVPTIKITSPDISSSGLLTEVGETTTFSITVTAEAGLSSVTMDGNVIKTYTGKETSSDITHDYLPLESGNFNINFKVEDITGKTASVAVSVVVEKGEDLGFLVLDFAGESTSSEEKEIVDWDIRTKYTFNVTGNLTSTATAEVVAKQAKLEFAQANPSSDDNSKVFKVIKEYQDEDLGSWGGWAHILLGFNATIPEDTITQLPSWDNENMTTIPGSKVIKLDVYYDATVDENFTWDSLTSLTDIWGADPTKGYKINVHLGSYDPMATVEDGADGSFYMGYTTYLTEPNKWVTLTFNKVADLYVEYMWGIAPDAQGPDAVSCVNIMPSPGYTSVDKNPLYFKNFRIVDIDQ